MTLTGATMPIVVADTVRIPWVKNIDDFRRWVKSTDFPERGQISYLNGDIWVDPSMERLSHNQIKGIICAVLTFLAKSDRLGRFIHDRMWLTCAQVELSTEPDGMFLSHESLRSKSVQLLEGGDSLQVEGVPDMVLEVVSPTSIHKDTEVLRELYAKAGIAEYWLVQAQGKTFTLNLLRLTARVYVPARKQKGWMRSTVFGKSFRLTETTDEHNLPEFNLEVR